VITKIGRKGNATPFPSKIPFEKKTTKIQKFYLNIQV
jgi:hypothetical protein